jgi:hypothetical protein
MKFLSTKELADMRFKRILILAGLSMLGLSMHVTASTMSVSFNNSNDATSIFLWTDSPNVTLSLPSSITFISGMTGWNQSTQLPDKVQISGPELNAGAGKFRVTLTYSAPRKFDLQWAEVLTTGAATILQGSGGLTFDGVTPGHFGWYDNNHQFTHIDELGLTPNLKLAAVPLPGSVLLMLPALMVVSTVGRRAQHGGTNA